MNFNVRKCEFHILSTIVRDKINNFIYIHKKCLEENHNMSCYAMLTNKS